MKRAVVVGGGVAGIAAATALADCGLEVVLVEKRPMLGGRASSFYDHETGGAVDGAQHGTMRCCTNLAALLERLGVHDRIRYHDVIHFLDAEGRHSVIKGCGLPAPCHTVLSFLRFRSLTLADKFGIARAFVAILRTRLDRELDADGVGSWFRSMRLSDRAIGLFLEPILVSACNDTIDSISRYHAFKVLRDGFLANSTGFHFGVPSVPLGELYTDPTVRYLEQRGGRVLRRRIVDRLLFGGDRAVGVALNDGNLVEADVVISALQFDLLLKLVPQDRMACDAYFEPIRRLQTRPIVGVHMWLDREVNTDECVALLGRRTDWIFNKTRNFGLSDTDGTYLSMVVSADEELVEMTKDEILALVMEEVRACVPALREAGVRKSYVVKERKATFAPAPGVESLRPDQRSPIPGLYIAGEWTNTGWPSTMESAARSGYLAAEKAMADLGEPKALLAPDLLPGWLARSLMRE